MRCNYCPATKGLRRVNGMTPTGHKVSIAICRKCMVRAADDLAKGKQARRARRAMVDVARAMASSPRKRRTIKDKMLMDRAQKAFNEATSSLEEAE